MDCYDSVGCIGKCGEECETFLEQKLSLINTLHNKVVDYDCDSEVCHSVEVEVDDEVRKVFKECGYTDREIDESIEDGNINLTLIGFKYGSWWDSSEGFSIHE